jgi:hypothetical protein
MTVENYIIKACYSPNYKGVIPDEVSGLWVCQGTHPREKYKADH